MLGQTREDIMRSYIIERIARIVAVAALIGGLGFQAAAGPLKDISGEVESAVAAGDSARAVDLARNLLDEVWTAVPLGFSTVVLVQGDPSGFGIYDERETNSYKPGEPIVIYAEPFGFGYGLVQEGIYRIGFDVDLVVKSGDGAVLAELPDIMQLGLTTRRRNKEFLASITYNLTGAPPGRYVLATTLRDQNSDKAASFEMPVEIAE